MVQVTKDHYGSSYHGRERYYSYAEQIALTVETDPGETLEIGVGGGVVLTELRRLGFSVTSVDIDPTLNPDIVAGVEMLPFADESFDLVSCCQVLEHLPFENFSSCLGEIRRVSRAYILISLPNSASYFRFTIAKGWSPIAQRGFAMSGSPFRRPAEHHFDGQHFWEIGKQGYPTARILSEIARVGLAVNKAYRFHLNPYHHFFLLKKQPAA